jgi:ATP-dependent helicase/nuclease subunit B
VLAEFHEYLKAEGRRWRDATPDEACDIIKTIAAARIITFRDGLLQSSHEARFTARMLVESLQDFVETVVGWLREGRQYGFDPAAAELPFGDRDNTFPPWGIDLAGGQRLLLHGRIDRVDLWREPGADEALCIVVDYKSSLKRLDPILMENGIQLQLAAYLSVLRHWAEPRPVFGVGKLVPSGVFYVNLRGNYGHADDRDESLAGAPEARKRAYRHMGRFDERVLSLLDQRPGVTEGDQFNYRKTNTGKIHGGSREAMATKKFHAMLDAIETMLKQMGERVYAGEADVDPFRKGARTACDHCDYQSICRIDPWTHRYRILRKVEESTEEISVLKTRE